ncbi:vanin-like protein 3 [Phymastichus coffea]|uniref:vanin-like protein 3 n=1 Tax=Phymastichus coffea TaxID=108790 RepID=UPI00273B0BB7|nr:vanin-like protein 3 [Phymastichus coffea]XP_058803489.1 vanin-like protein 3 [Phymastichus coffea]XP_058803490.1 vanin-like protein 3 [Phymastichus coffea]
MIPHLLRLGMLLCLSKLSLQQQAIGSPSYVGAVVEYHPVTDGDDGSTIAVANANNYRTIIKNASEYKVDIIVFPEFGLTSLPKDGNGAEKKFNATEYRAYYRNTASYIPNPNESVILCDTDNKYQTSLQTISCAAREYKMYVVVNHHEHADCPKSNCAPGNFLLYNTNVVFDRKGKVIAKYRKYNLFNEPGTNVTAQPEYSTFTTDFGVTFGQFICFDIVQEKPANFFVRNPNVTDIVYSTHWYDELPFNDAIQQQAAWAYGADVNLLASGYSDAQTSSGGSGIYAGKRGPIKIHQPRETSNALVVAKISKLNRQKRIEDVRAGRSFVHVFKQAEIPTVSGVPLHAPPYPPYFHDDLRPYTTQLLDPTQGSHITTLCDNELCCDFHVETNYDKKAADTPNTQQYKYRVAVFNGVRNVMNQTTAGLEVCALIACAGDRIEDCGSIYHANLSVVQPTTFDSFIITRRANLSSRVFYEPSTLTMTDRQPIDNGDFAYVISGHKNSSLLLMYLVRPKSDVMTFAIYGRKFDRDGEEVTRPKSNGPSITPSFVVVMMIMILMTLRNCK